MAGATKCTAKAKRTGKQCNRWAVAGATVCIVHGGAAPQVRRAAARRLALGEAEEFLEEQRGLGRPLPVDPAEAMLAMVAEAAGNVAVYRHLVNQLERIVDGQGDAYLTEGDDGVTETRYSGGQGGLAGNTGNEKKTNETAPHVWVTLYNEERDRLVKYAQMARACGAEERRIELAEAQARVIVGVVQGAVDEVLALVRGELGGTFPEAIEAHLVERMPQILAGQLRKAGEGGDDA